jgi:hypothetical protein
MARSGYNLLGSAGRYLMLSRSIPDLRVSDLTTAVLRGNPDFHAIAVVIVLNAEICGSTAPWVRELRDRLSKL